MTQQTDSWRSWRRDIIFSHASVKAERDLSSLSCVYVYVDQNKGTVQYPTPTPQYSTL